MAIGEIIIHKIWVNGEIGCYEISSENFDINIFYIAIDKSKKTVSFFLTKNSFDNPIRTIDYNKDEPIGSIPGIPMKVFTTILMRSVEVFRTDSFPEFLHYAA